MAPKAPRHRTFDHGRGVQLVLFPKEVATCLAIDNISYDQLRRFYHLIRNPAEDEELNEQLHNRWARWSVTDLACLAVALERCGGSELLHPGRRQTWGNLPDACKALFAQGFEVPLLDVELHRLGRRVFARFDGVLQDPVNGQLAIQATADRLDQAKYFSGSLLKDREIRRAVMAEVKRHRGLRGRRR